MLFTFFYGKRKNILVIHDDEGKKTYTRLDITDPNILNSPSYYLAQNDIVIMATSERRVLKVRINNIFCYHRHCISILKFDYLNLSISHLID